MKLVLSTSYEAARVTAAYRRRQAACLRATPAEAAPERARSMARPTLTIDGSCFSTLQEFYGEVSRKIIPGASWGRNLDAFNDILRGGFGTPEGGFILIWHCSEVSRDRLGHGEAAQELERRLERCHPSNRGQVELELQAARGARGPTAFDWLVEVIRSHDGIELRLQ